MNEIFYELGIFSRELRDIKDIIDKNQTRTPLIKYELQNSIQKVMSKNKNKEKLFWLNSDEKN